MPRRRRSRQRQDTPMFFPVPTFGKNSTTPPGSTEKLPQRRPFSKRRVLPHRSRHMPAGKEKPPWSAGRLQSPHWPRVSAIPATDSQLLIWRLEERTGGNGLPTWMHEENNLINQVLSLSIQSFHEPENCSHHTPVIADFATGILDLTPSATTNEKRPLYDATDRTGFIRNCYTLLLFITTVGVRRWLCLDIILISLAVVLTSS